MDAFEIIPHLKLMDNLVAVAGLMVLLGVIGSNHSEVKRVACRVLAKARKRPYGQR